MIGADLRAVAWNRVSKFCELCDAPREVDAPRELVLESGWLRSAMREVATTRERVFELGELRDVLWGAGTVRKRVSISGWLRGAS